jgi:hypothetical protein
MKRDEILGTARADCLRMFSSLLAGLPKRSADKAFAMAYKTTNFTEHRLFLDAFSALNNRAPAIEKQLHANLSLLLERSAQTAYNPRRSTELLAAGVDDWSLVDGNAIDAEIRLQKISGLFHARSGEDIRTLNLRVAALFDQEMVKERENPFRPYLFSRSILEAVNGLRLPPDVTELVIEQIAVEMVDGVAEIYQALNAYFEREGIPARLIVKPMPSGPVSAENTRRHGAVQDKDASRAWFPYGASTDAAPGAQAGATRMAGTESGMGAVVYPAYKSGRAAPIASPSRIAKLEQLFRMVRRKAGQPGMAKEQFESLSLASDGAFDEAGLYSPLRGERGNFSVEEPGVGIPDEGWIGSGQIARGKLQLLFTLRDPALSPSQGASSYVSGPAASSSIAQTPVFHHLQRADVPNLVELVDSAGEVRNLIFESRAALQSKASGVDEMMTIDVVGMIFEFILRDAQVPAEIRAQLGRLQFHMLKIALIDPQLLSHENHPARKLINRVGTISTGLKQSDAFTQLFSAEVQRLVEAMLADEAGSIVLVARLLEEFEAFVAQHLRSSNAQVENAVEAIEVAERRSVYFSRLNAELQSVLATITVDSYLKDFIQNAWLNAIEKVEHTDAQLGQRYRTLVPELLWSILGKPNERERARLLAHLPQMLFDLKAGLGAIRYQERQVFLSWLVESHTAAIKGTGYLPEQPSLSALRKDFQAFIELSAQDHGHTKTAGEFDRRFIRDAAEEMSLKLDEIETIMEFGNTPSTESGADPHAKNSGASAEDISADDVLNRLRVGVPVEVNVDGAPRKAQLNWVNASATNIVLTFENKDVPTTISVSLFRRLLANERARFIEAAPLFERAVSALLETADTVDEFFV